MLNADFMKAHGRRSVKCTIDRADTAIEQRLP